MDIEKELEKQWKHVNVYGSVAVFNNMKEMIKEIVKELEGQLNTAENELIELRAYKQSAEAKLKEYEQATKLSGEVNAKLVGELLDRRAVPVFDAGLVSAILEDYADLQTSGQIPTANRYSASDARGQAELLDAYLPAPVVPDDLRLVKVDDLKRIHRDLDSCQKVIWLARGFDPAYCKDAQESLRIIDEILAAAPSHSQQSAEQTFELLMRDITEQEPADPDSDRTVSVNYDWLYSRVREAFCPSHESEQGDGA